MKQKDAIKLCNEKITELKTTIASLKTNETISKATRGTQLYARGRERRVLHLISSLCNQIEDIKLDEDDMNTFILITTLASERTAPGTIECKVGEPIFTVAQRYPNKSFDKLVHAIEKQGLKVDAKGIIVEAK